MARRMRRKIAEDGGISTELDRNLRLPSTRSAPNLPRMLRVTPYRSIAVAATFSPRFHAVLAEANRVCTRFGANLNMIHVGKHDAATARKFAEAVTKIKLPANSNVHYEEGDPADSILAAARKLNVDLLVAGALEKEAAHRQFLGNVARRLAREASCSVLLF